MSMSHHELAEQRKCGKCKYADKEALEHNKQAHDEERWSDSKAWCTYPFGLFFNDDGTCKKMKEIE